MGFNKNKAIAAAQKHAQRGNYARAIKEYLVVLEFEPDDVRTWLRVADLYKQSGAVSNAIQTYRRVAEDYREKGFFQKGLAVYKQILTIDPANLDAHLSLGECYVQLKRAPEAIRQFQTVVGTYERDGRFAEGQALLRRIVDLAPDNNANRIRLAESLARADNKDEAVETFRTVLGNLYDRGVHDDFIQVAERLLYLAPDHMDVVQQLSEVYLLKNDAKRALARLQTAFKSDPTNPTTLSLLGRAFAKIGQTAKAVSVYRELARVHEENGDDASRINAFQSLLALDPNDPDALAATGGAVGDISATPSMRSAPGGSIEEALSNDELAKRYVVDAQLYRKYGLDDHAYDRLKAIFEFEPVCKDAAPAFRELAQELDRGDDAAQVLLVAADAVAQQDRQHSMALLGEVLQLVPGHGGAEERMRALSAGMHADLPGVGEEIIFDDDDGFSMDLDDVNLDELEFDDGLGEGEGGLSFEIDPNDPAPDDDEFGDLLGEESSSEFADLMVDAPASAPPDDDAFGDVLQDAPADDGFGDLLQDAPADDGFGDLLQDGGDDFGDLLADDGDVLDEAGPAASVEFGDLLEGDPIAPPPPDDFGDLLQNDAIAPPPPDDFDVLLDEEPASVGDDFGDLLAPDEADDAPIVLAPPPPDDFEQMVASENAPPPPLDDFDDDSIDADEATIALQADDLNLAQLIRQTEASSPPPPRSAPPPQLPPEDSESQLDDFFAELGADEMVNHEDLFESVDRGTVDASDISERLNADELAPPANADDFGDLIGRRTPAPVSAPAQPMEFVGESQDSGKPEPLAAESTPNPVLKPRGRVAPGSLPPLPRRPSGIQPLKPPPPLAPRRRPSLAEMRIEPEKAPEKPLEKELATTPPPAAAPPEFPPPPPLPSTPPAAPPAIADFDLDEATEARDINLAAGDDIELLDDDLIELEDEDFDIEDYEEPDSLSGSIADSMANLSGTESGIGLTAEPPAPPLPDAPDANATAQVDIIDDIGDFDDDDDDDDATIMGDFGGGFGLPPPPSMMAPSDVGEPDAYDETVALNGADLGAPAAEELAELDFLTESALIEDATELLVELERKFPAHPELIKRRRQIEGGTEEAEHDELLDSIEANEADFATVAGAQLSDLSHDDASTHFDLGVAFKEMGQYAKAIEQLEVAARSLERRSEALQLIALCHMESGHPDRGAETLQAALANADLATKQRHDLQYDLATAYEQLGDTLRATQQLHAIAQEAGDDYRDVRARLTRLET